MQATVPQGSIAPELSNTSDDKASSTVVDVATRTEVLLILREAMYRLCELRMNGDIESREAVAIFDYVLRTARVLSERDNVAKLIDQLKEAPANQRRALLATIMSLSLGEALASDTELMHTTTAAEDSSQERAAAAIRQGLQHLLDTPDPEP